MANPSEANIRTKAREILATPSYEGLITIINQLYLNQESEEYKSAQTLYNFFVSRFPNCLTQKLLKIYESSSDDVVRLRSICHLSKTLTDLRSRKFELSLVTLHEIKPLLISCLINQNPRKCDTDYLRIIVSFVVDNVLILDNEGWDEFSDYMLTLTDQDPVRSFSYFVDLPSVYCEFGFSNKLLEEVYKVLLHPEVDRVEDWVLALKCAVKMGILFMDSETRFDSVKGILWNVMNSANEVVSMGLEVELLLRGIQSLESYLVDDAKLYEWSTAQCSFVAGFAYQMAGIGTCVREAAKKIYVMVTRMENYVHNPKYILSPIRVENQELGVEADLELYNHFRERTPQAIMSFVAVPDHDYRSREIAIRRLYDMFCDHASSQWEIDVVEIKYLQPLIIKCLKEEGMPENVYRILGQVVYHVAEEIISYEKDPWFDLWDYISSESKAEFKKAVYIFQCLTMQLEFKDIVVPAITSLLPEIVRSLTPPTELLIDNSSWVLTFTGAFCSAIHLLEVPSHGGYVKEVAQKMIDSVKELVERRMEVGLVRRAFRDVESIVKKQVEWYMTCEYRFVKGLLWRLYTIQGMKMESKIVLWRINFKIDKSVDDQFKVVPKTEFDWLNQPEPSEN